jgi:hypothetical protein
MSRRGATRVALVLLMFSGACRASPPQSAAPAAAPAEPAIGRPNDVGAIDGTVAASGTAVVALEPKSPRTFPPQSEKPVMDQVGLKFCA